MRALRKLPERHRHEQLLQHALVRIPVWRRRCPQYRRLELHPASGLWLPHQVPGQSGIDLRESFVFKHRARRRDRTDSCWRGTEGTASHASRRAAQRCGFPGGEGRHDDCARRRIHYTRCPSQYLLLEHSRQRHDQSRPDRRGEGDVECERGREALCHCLQLRRRSHDGERLAD